VCRVAAIRQELVDYARENASRESSGCPVTSGCRVNSDLPKDALKLASCESVVLQQQPSPDTKVLGRLKTAFRPQNSMAGAAFLAVRTVFDHWTGNTSG
jgi:hypothetical protein